MNNEVISHWIKGDVISFQGNFQSYSKVNIEYQNPLKMILF